jgi:ABC-2 type transport system permease protein
MKRIIAQIQKEIRQFLRDRLTVALAFVLPLITLLILGYAIRLEEKNISIAIQDEDNSPLSRAFTERLLATDQLEGESYTSHDILHSAIDTGRAQAAIIIPPEFSRRFKAGRTASIEVIIDGTDVNNARVIRNSVLAVTQQFQISLQQGPHSPPIKADIRLWFNPGRKESLYVVPGTFGLILWIYPNLLAAIALAREKEQGTILQAYASSITAFELIVGKALAYLIIGISISTFVVVIGMILFQLRFVGDPTPFLVGTALFVLDSVLFGLMIGSITTTQNAAVQAVAFAGFTPALLLSGFLYPLRNIKYPFNYLSYIFPTRYYMPLARDSFVRGAGWTSLWGLVLLFVLFAGIYFLRTKHRMNRMQLEG